MQLVIFVLKKRAKRKYREKKTLHIYLGFYERTKTSKENANYGNMLVKVKLQATSSSFLSLISACFPLKKI